MIYPNSSIIDKKSIEILLEVCDFYENMCNTLNAKSKLDGTMIEDALIRLKNNEYLIIRNPKY